MDNTNDGDQAPSAPSTHSNSVSQQDGAELHTEMSGMNGHMSNDNAHGVTTKDGEAASRSGSGGSNVNNISNIVTTNNSESNDRLVPEDRILSPAGKTPTTDNPADSQRPGLDDLGPHFFSDDLANRNAGKWLDWGCCPRFLTLPVATISCAILGMGIGFLLSTYADLPDWALQLIYYPGELWVRGLKLIILPLIISIMIIIPSSLAGDMNDESNTSGVSGMGSLAMKFYTFTSFIAAIEGTIWGNIMQPGKQVPSDFDEFGGETTDTKVTWFESILNIGKSAIPENIVDAMYNLNILGIICVFLTMGLILNSILQSEYNKTYDPHYKTGAKTVVHVFKTLLRCIMIIIGKFIWFTPIGMLSLVMYQCASTENLVDLLMALGYYVVTVLIGQFCHLFLFYPLVFFLVTGGQNGWAHWWRIKYVSMVAFATSSSAATLSVALSTAKTSGGVSGNVVNFIIPLGATVNMDGAGLSYQIQVLFIAQLYGINLEFGTQLTVLILSVVCSVGAAPIPSAGMVYLIMLLTVAGNGLEDDAVITSAVATLFLIDWFIDRIGTAVNVSSDQYVAKMIDEVFKSKNDGKKSCGTTICCMKVNDKMDKVANDDQDIDMADY